MRNLSRKCEVACVAPPSFGSRRRPQLRLGCSTSERGALARGSRDLLRRSPAPTRQACEHALRPLSSSADWSLVVRAASTPKRAPRLRRRAISAFRATSMRSWRGRVEDATRRRRCSGHRCRSRATPISKPRRTPILRRKCTSVFGPAWRATRGRCRPSPTRVSRRTRSRCSIDGSQRVLPPRPMPRLPAAVMAERPTRRRSRAPSISTWPPPRSGRCRRRATTNTFATAST